VARRDRRWVGFIAVGLALSLTAAACGDDDGGEAGASGTGGGGAAGEGGGDRSEWPDTLVFGAVPAEASNSLEDGMQPIVDILEQELDLEVELHEATDYAGVIEAQIAGTVHLAQYGPFSYVIAKDQGANIEPVGSVIDEPDAEPGYQSYGMVPADSDIESIEDFAGRTVCFVDPSSTSGYLYPSAGLLDADIDPESDVEPVFAGGHDASVISVGNGDCEAGFAFDDMVDETAPAELGVAEDDLSVVWESEVIPGSPIAVSLDLPESLVDEIRRVLLEQANSDALLEAGLCDGECRLTDEQAWGFAEVDDEYFDGVREVCEATEAEACQE
jgi:phosphonate transport system substrate-binding protein